MVAPQQPSGIRAASTGVLSVAPSAGMASAQAMAYPATAPMAPLGAFSRNSQQV